MTSLGPATDRTVVDVVDEQEWRRQVREFLVSRRAAVTPEQSGLLPGRASARRVPGLRREEVALLAGVSVDYYTRLERGNLKGVSSVVLAAVADALRLDEAERAHLADLARVANESRRVRSGRTDPAHDVRPSLLRVLDAVSDAPAYLRNGRRDVLATNRLGAALYAPLLGSSTVVPGAPANIARFLFLDQQARTFFADWDRSATDVVASLRIEAGRNPFDAGLSELVGELSTRSDAFAERWASHDVRFHRSGTKSVRHPVVGRLDLTYEVMELPTDPGLALIVYGAEPGTTTADALHLLASWAATPTDDGTDAPTRPTVSRRGS